MSKILIDEATVMLALGALESKDTWGSSIRDAKERAITALRETLAEPSLTAGFVKKIESLIAERDALIAKLAEQPAQTEVIAGRTVKVDWKTQALELRELVRLGGIKIAELEAALAEQPAQQEPVAKMGMYEHKCPNVTGHRGPSFVCQKAGHGVGQNSYCKGCICPEALNTSQLAPVQQGWPSDCLVSEKAKQSGFDLSPMPNLLYTVRGNHAQLVNFARAMLATAPQPAQQEPVAYWIPKAEQFCIASPSGRPFAKAWEPLYTSPPAQRKPLPPSDVVAMWHEARPAHAMNNAFDWYKRGVEDAEAAHSIKENT